MHLFQNLLFDLISLKQLITYFELNKFFSNIKFANLVALNKDNPIKLILFRNKNSKYSIKIKMRSVCDNKHIFFIQISFYYFFFFNKKNIKQPQGAYRRNIFQITKKQNFFILQFSAKHQWNSFLFQKKRELLKIIGNYSHITSIYHKM